MAALRWHHRQPMGARSGDARLYSRRGSESPRSHQDAVRRRTGSTHTRRRTHTHELPRRRAGGGRLLNPANPRSDCGGRDQPASQRVLLSWWNTLSAPERADCICAHESRSASNCRARVWFFDPTSGERDDNSSIGALAAAETQREVGRIAERWRTPELTPRDDFCCWRIDKQFCKLPIRRLQYSCSENSSNCLIWGALYP